MSTLVNSVAPDTHIMSVLFSHTKNFPQNVKTREQTRQSQIADFDPGADLYH